MVHEREGDKFVTWIAEKLVPTVSLTEMGSLEDPTTLVTTPFTRVTLMAEGPISTVGLGVGCLVGHLHECRWMPRGAK